MSQIHDINGQTLYKIASLFDLPDFVKQASRDRLIPQQEDFLPNSYADTDREDYPCHTAEATLMSTAYFLLEKSGMSKARTNIIESGLQKAAQIHGVVNHYNNIIKQAENFQKYDNNEMDYALVIETEDGQKQKLYPVRNKKEASTALNYLLKNSHELDYKARNAIAVKLLDSKDRFELPIDESVETILNKHAGEGYSYTNKVANSIFERAKTIFRINKSATEPVEALIKLAKSCLENEELHNDKKTLVKLASFVDEVDQIYGLHKHGFDLIENELFCLSDKIIDKTVSEHVQTPDGYLYKRADLRKIPTNELAQILNKEIDITADKENLINAMSSCQRHQYEKLNKTAAHYNVKPVKKLNNKNYSFFRDHLLELSDMHDNLKN